ncbi:MAG: hypothetical protein R3F49_12030 [Planctomycetota bacterium]
MTFTSAVRRGLATFLFAQCVASVSAQTIYRVSAAAPVGGDGQTWGTAFQSLDDALALASAGDRVWVAAGLYRPSVERLPGDPRSRSFTPRQGVYLFGGFAGTELNLVDRAGLFRSTVLDGDLGVPGVVSDNATNVVRLEGNGARHWVDGFTITGGNADQTGLARGGGAIAAQLGEKFIRNCSFFGNRGRVGGALLSQISIMHVETCTFVDNSATESGGALYATSSFTVTDSLFARNVSAGRGGAVYANQGGLDTENIPITRFQNCVFHDNIANNGGAAFVGDPNGVVSAGKVVWSGCTFYANLALTGGAAIATNATFSNATDVRLFNSIVWGNLSRAGTMLGGDASHYNDVRHSVIEGGWPGSGNLNSDPRFVNVTARNLRLAAGSPAIDSGDNGLVLRDRNDLDDDGDFNERAPFDITGAARNMDDPQAADTGVGNAPITDMGAYERRGL